MPDVDQGQVAIFSATASNAARGISPGMSLTSNSNSMRPGKKAKQGGSEFSGPGKKQNIGARRAREAMLQKETDEKARAEVMFKMMIQDHLMNENEDMHVLEIKDETDLPDLMPIHPL